MTVGVNSSLNGFVPFPADNPWNTRVDTISANPSSTSLINAYISRVGGTNPAMQGDFGGIYGEKYNIVDSSTQATQLINVNGYPAESDIMPVPFSNSAAVEGGKPCPSGNDCHLFILDKNQCWLYETWLTNYNGTWSASNMAVWDMLNTTQRPYGWTSADAAGLPIFPGLVRYDEVAAGAINHAIRFTLTKSADSFVAPASHSAGSDTVDFPMGTRFRLKASFDVSHYSAVNQVILNAMKKYGIILADNGLELEFAAAWDSRWQSSDVSGIRSVHFTDFELLPSGTAYPRTSVPRGSNPAIAGFTASDSSVQSGAPVTLSWSTTGASWNFIDLVGPVRGNSVVVFPTATTTYTLKSTNAYGRTSQSITVQVLH